MKLKKGLVSATSMFLALFMTMSGSSYRNGKGKDVSSTPMLPPSIDGSLVEEIDEIIESEPVSSESVVEVSQSVEEFITYETPTPVSVQPNETPEVEYEYEVEENEADEWDCSSDYVDRRVLINRMNVDSTLKSILYEMSKSFPNSSSAEVFIELTKASISDIPNLLVQLVQYSYNGVYTHIHSSGVTAVYPAEGIKIFDNRSGVVDLPKCVYMLHDPSRFGDYLVYRQDIAPHGGIIGTNVIITDKNNRVLVTMHRSYGECTYSVVKNKGLYATDFGDYLDSVNLSFKKKDEYVYADLFKLKFEISKVVGNYDASDTSKYDAKNVLVLEIPEKANHWYFSNEGNECSYYFLVKQVPYLFEEDTYVCDSILHDSAFVTYSSSSDYGLEYRDSDESISINLCSQNPQLETIVSFEQFAQENGYRLPEVLSRTDLVYLYDAMCENSLSAVGTSMTMVPVENK